MMVLMKELPLPRIEDLSRMRVLYRRRGPRDGQAGITPDGRVAVPWSYSVRAVVADAVATMEMDDPTLARWREGMGLNDPPQPRVRWGDACPARGVGLTHARTQRDPAGTCVHCKAKIT